MKNNDMETYLNRANRIIPFLADSESLFLFNARFDYYIDKDESKLLQRIWDYYSDYKLPCDTKETIMVDLNNLGYETLKCDNKEGIVICGCGHEGVMNLKVARSIGLNVVGFTDKKKSGSVVEGVKVYDIASASKLFQKSVFIISSYAYRFEIFYELIMGGVSKDHIFIPNNKYIVGVRGVQYFDCFDSRNCEVFVDCGAYDGAVSKYYIEKWSQSDNEVYLLEPLKEMYEYLQKEFCGNNRVKVINCAAWDREEKIYFENSGTSSCVSENGSEYVNGAPLDGIIKNKKNLYIKMDIEGAEYNALIGAKQIIQEYHPRLAISIYHKSEDILDIPNLILDFYDGYKLYIKHYSTIKTETVLYAVP